MLICNSLSLIRNTKPSARHPLVCQQHTAWLSMAADLFLLVQHGWCVQVVRWQHLLVVGNSQPWTYKYGSAFSLYVSGGRIRVCGRACRYGCKSRICGSTCAGTLTLTPLHLFHGPQPALADIILLIQPPVYTRVHFAGALLLDPFRTVVPAAAYAQPSAAEVAQMSLLDAHCGTFQQV